MKIRKQRSFPRCRVSIRLLGEMSRLRSALQEFGVLMNLRLELERDLDVVQLCQRFVRVPFEADDFFRAHSESAAGRAGDVLVSLEPSDRFLELLAALRHRPVSAARVRQLERLK